MRAGRTFASIVVDGTKLRDYCLSDLHPRGRHKARVFRSRLGLTAGDTELLRHALLNAANTSPHDLKAAGVDAYGQRFVLDFEMKTDKGTAIVRSGWILQTGRNVLQFVTCYVLA